MRNETIFSYSLGTFMVQPILNKSLYGFLVLKRTVCAARYGPLPCHNRVHYLVNRDCLKSAHLARPNARPLHGGLVYVVHLHMISIC